MKLLHNTLSKPKRALRAYLNVDKPPLGFKGNKLADKSYSKEPVEHDLTPHNLARYAYHKISVMNALEDLGIVFENTDGGPRMTLDPISKEDIAESGTLLQEMLSKPQKISGFYAARQALDAALPHFSPIDEKTVGNVNEFYQVVLGFFLTNLELHLLAFSNSAKQEIDETIISLTRMSGGNFNLPHYLSAISLHFLDDGKSIMGTEEIKAMEMLYAMLHSWGISNTEKNTKDGGRNGLGRGLFSRNETRAFRFLHKHLFSLTEQLLFDAIKLEGIRHINQPYVDRLLKLHQKYGFSIPMEWEGQNFILEASPFAEKRIGSPIGNFMAAIYPTESLAINAMREIADPPYEHADGALAIAAFTVSKDRLILEELQTDIHGLLIRSRKDLPEPLKDIYGDWLPLSFAAARAFARRNGYAEFYGSTPYRMFSRYRGIIHPDRTKAYFSGMEKLGGKLVYDDEGVLDKERQHYYRFEL